VTVLKPGNFEGSDQAWNPRPVALVKLTFSNTLTTRPPNSTGKIKAKNLVSRVFIVNLMDM